MMIGTLTRITGLFLAMGFFGFSPLLADPLAVLGTESYPQTFQLPPRPVMALGPSHWGPTSGPMAYPVMVQPMVVQPMVSYPAYAYAPGYVGLVPAPVYVNYQLWTP